MKLSTKHILKGQRKGNTAATYYGETNISSSGVYIQFNEEVQWLTFAFRLSCSEMDKVVFSN